MKKVLLSLLFVLGVFVLIGCQKEFEKVVALVEVGYAEGDSKESVTKNVDLPTSLNDYPDASISWNSSNTSIILVSGTSGVVTRQTADETITLTASISFKNDSGNKVFVLTIKAAEELDDPDNPDDPDDPDDPVDIVAPIINGTKNWNLTVGDEKPNWLEGVSAIDDVDDSVVVIVDDSDVDMNNPGTYTIVYEATDEAGNTSTTNVNVFVKAAVIPNQSFIEDFEDTSLPSTSTYGDATYTGINDIVWQFTHVQEASLPSDGGNYAIDGKSVLLRRSNEPSSIVATFEDGISALSFEYRKGYTSQTTRNYEVIITPETGAPITTKITFSAVTGDDPTVHTFTYTGEPLTGKVIVKIVAVGSSGNQHLVVDNFKWTTNAGSGVDKVGPVISGTKNWTLAVNDPKPNWLDGVTALDAVDGPLAVNVDDSKVVLTAAGIYDLVYSATDSSSNKTEVKVSVTVGTPVVTYDTIAMSLEKDHGETSTIKGVVTGLLGNNTFAIQDETGAMALYNATPLAVEAGKEYVISGTRGHFNNLEQLTGAVIVSEIGPKTPVIHDIDAVGLTSSVLGEYQAQLISVSNLKVISRSADAFGTITIRLENETGVQIDLRADNRFPDFLTVIAPTLNALVAGTSYDFIAHIGWYTTTAQLIFDNNSVATETTSDPGDEVITTIANLHTKVTNDSLIKTQGVIYAQYATAGDVIFFIQDGNSGIMITAPISMQAQIVTGKEIVVKATKSNLDGQAILNTVTNIEILGDASTYATSVTKLDMFDKKNSYIALEGFLATNYVSDQSSFVLKTINGDVKLLIPSNLDAVNKAAIAAFFTGKLAGSYIEVVGPAYKQSGENYLLILGSSSLALGTADNNALGALVVSYLTLPKDGSKIATDITLPTTGLFGLNIVWSSSVPGVISNTGVYTKPSENTDVVLTYEIKNSLNETIFSANINITALSGAANYTGTYYNGINLSLTGDALKAQLTTLISVMNLKTYGDARYISNITDADPEVPGNVILMYNRASVSGAWDGGATWNREHVWPQSKLGASASNNVANTASDLQNLKPANPSINSSRGNLSFVDKPGGGSYGAVPGGYYPGDEDRGDVARILFYMNTRWGLSIPLVGDLATLIKWHTEDPVDTWEMNRNELIYSYQNNRNPYIDLPDLVYSVYSTMGGTSVEVTSPTATLGDLYGNADLSVVYYCNSKRDVYSV